MSKRRNADKALPKELFTDEYDNLSSQVLDVKHQQPADIETQIRRYKVITPLFGGGFEASVNDPNPTDLIRGSEIDGQLRFWWRATRGCFTPEEIESYKKKLLAAKSKTEPSALNLLRATEGKIWGQANAQDDEEQAVDTKESDHYDYTTQIEVTIEKSGSSQDPFSLDIPSYASFPLRETKDDQGNEESSLKEIREDITFTLKISYQKEYYKEISAALWAWEIFGGVGARTRRGFGALKRTSIIIESDGGQKVGTSDYPPADASTALQWLQNRARDNVKRAEKWPDDVPHLSREFKDKQNIYITTATSDAKGRWRVLINALKDFRLAKNSTQKSSRSAWPEADAIRAIEREKSSYTSHSTLNPVIQKFPRAAFGLPIIFEFKDKGRGDPEQQTLQPADALRYASPLILKPLSCKDEKYVGLAVILEGVYPEGKPFAKDALVLASHKDKPQSGLIQSQDHYNLLKSQNSAIQAADASDNKYSYDEHKEKAYDVRRAFLRYLSKKR